MPLDGPPITPHTYTAYYITRHAHQHPSQGAVPAARSVVVQHLAPNA